MEELALEAPQKSLRDYLDALARRKAGMLLVAALVMAGAVVVAYVLPPVWRSTATILIEEQEIPQDLVRTTISSYADQRIQVISQQVMTRANLMQIIQKYDLYRTERRYETSEEVLARMRKDIKLDLVNADVIDRRSGNRTAATIAFTLAFDGETSDKAQKVANELTSLYLNENLEIRKQKAAETSSFLAEEAERLSHSIGEIEARLAEFKHRNMDRLPELAQLNMQMRERTEAEKLDVDRQIASLDERRFYLQAQLAQIKPNTPIISASGERIMDPEERLRSLRAQVAGLAGVYSANHPDMGRARAQIEALEREVGTDAPGLEEAKQLEKLNTDLAGLRRRYADDHPDVVRLTRIVVALEEAVRRERPAAAAIAARKPENPAYIALQAQLDAIDTEQRALRSRRQDLGVRLADLEQRLQQTPQVEREYLDLSRDRENSVVRYRELKAKLMEAEVAQELERGRKSERFSLIDPPQYPEKPRSPNRPAIVLIGLVLALGGGLGYAGVAEGLDNSVRNARDLVRSTALPLLSVIPYISNGADHARRRRRRLLIAGGAFVAAVLALLLIHFFFMPLEVFWYWLLRRLRID